MKVFVIVLLAINLCLVGQTIYFSPGLDLVLTVYDPFFEMKPTRPNEIGLFQVPGKSATLQVVSLPMPNFNDLAAFGNLVGAQLIGARELATMNLWLGSQDFFYRRFTVALSEQKSEGAQLIFLRGGKGYVITYHANAEEFWQYLMPAMLTMTSLKLSDKPEVYLSAEYNYTVKLMGPFAAVKPVQGEIGAFASVVDQKRGYVQIVKENLPRRMKVTEYAQIVEKNTLSKLTNYELFASGSNYVEGLDFSWRIFSFERTGTKYRCVQANTLWENTAYTVMYLARDEDFDYFLPAAIYVMFSFKPLW